MGDFILSNIKIGIVKKHKELGTSIESCLCGTVRILEVYGRSGQPCEKCGNEKFLQLKQNESRTLTPYLEVIHKDRKGFKIKRTNLSVIIDDEYKVSIKKNQIQVMQYDLVNDEIRIWKNGHKAFEYKHDGRSIDRATSNNAYQRFFHQVDDNDFLKAVRSDGIGELFDFAYKDLSEGTNWSSGRKVYRGLVRLFDNKHIQILANAGYTNLKRFKESRNYWNRNHILNKQGSNPREILGLPKFAVSLVREDNTISTYEIKQLREAVTKMDGTTFKEMLSIAKDEGSIKKLVSMIDTLSEINVKYGYSNVKRLTLYLFRELKMNQGITNPSEGATLLRDYVKMSIKLGQEYEKYPKSLKKEHDIAQMNYKVKESEIKQKEFNDKVSSDEYKMLEIKSKDFSIISPKTMDELIKEGNELSHCVASYVGAIIDGNCNIYFLRKTDDLDSPYATVEVRGGRVRQARGYANRQLTKEEREFITTWAKKKELVENYYY